MRPACSSTKPQGTRSERENGKPAAFAGWRRCRSARCPRPSRRCRGTARRLGPVRPCRPRPAARGLPKGPGRQS
jgi:hypothetical protein